MKKRIADLLRQHGQADHLLVAGIEELALEHGEAVYKELFIQLVGKNLGTTQSSAYWSEIRQHRDRIAAASGWQLGIRAAAFDYLQQEARELINPVVIEAEHLENIRLSSITDGLTGLYHQTYFKNTLRNALSNHRRAQDQTAALILLDLDRFKQYNDRCGHLAGDDALQKVASIIRGQIREQDIAARYGGEEFAIFLPNATRNIARSVAERIRRRVEEAVFAGQERIDGGNLTISGGVAVYPADADHAQSLIEAADQELYRAKARRNTIYPDKGERRQGIRHRVQTLVEYAGDNAYNYCCGVVYDFSKAGIGFGSSNEHAPDDRVILRLRKPFWDEDLEVPGRIRQIRPDSASGLLFLGVEFDHYLDDVDRYLPKKGSPLAH